ncbi:histone deacetylase [Nocardioidaceae bacterium]|nr:histone deacetylase [Nocardioidaceae bacterium]
MLVTGARGRRRRRLRSGAVSEVWYVSYGSNMSAARLQCYLVGGCPPGGRRENPGARLATAPTRSAAVELPGSVYFAGESPQWGGGTAFYDHDTPGPAAARAYLVTAGQLADIFRQEMYLAPFDGDPVERVAASLPDDDRHAAGDGVYETLVAVGRLDGLPMLTFTSPHGAADVPHTEPAPAYLATMATGLVEAHGWDEERAYAYLAGLTPPGRR